MEVAVLAGLVGIGYLFNSKNKDNNPINNSVQKEVSTPNGENVYHSEFYNEADKVIRTLASNNFEESYEDGSKIICISEKEGMIYNEMGININNLIEYKEEKGSILGFPDATYDKNPDNSLFIK